ncbi:hypothetical protein [Acidisphaera sp. L21]|uniref:hypothetical protein n=1 Tax=Acidisphaera sp. L21 TaxID=1641851 RepID=UPI00131D5260|nr:hypothetical protein [Acidisphaera sp. L21]
MVQRTINHFYPTYAEAVEVVADLTAAGISSGNIALIESETDARLPQGVATDTAQSPALTGGTLGAAIGAGIGALDGVGSITIPFTEPLVATGWVLPCLVFAVIGALIGAVVGMVTKLGVSNSSSHAIASRLQRGEHLVMVWVDEADAAAAQVVLDHPRVTPGVKKGPDPVYDMEPTGDSRTVEEEAAAIHQAERRIQYQSE